MNKPKSYFIVFFWVFLHLSLPAQSWAGNPRFQIRILGQIGNEQKLKEPIGIAVFGEKVFVSDSGQHLVHIYHKDGAWLKSFGQKGKNPGQFSNPKEIVVASTGELYVVDQGNSRIQVFSKNGEFIRSFGEGILSKPQGISLGPNFRVFVADTGNSQVAVFSRDGIFLGPLGSVGKLAGQLHSPVSVVALKNGSLIVADEGNKNLILLEGTDRNQKLGQSLQGGIFRGLLADPTGRAFAISRDSSKLIILDPKGNILHSFGSAGQGRGQFNNPAGMAFEEWFHEKNQTSKSYVIYLVNTGNKRVDRFQIQVNEERPLQSEAYDQARFYQGELLKSHVLLEVPFEDSLYSVDPHKGQIYYRKNAQKETLKNPNPNKRTFLFGYQSIPEKPSLLNYTTGLTVGRSRVDQGEGSLLFYLSENRDHKVHVLDAKGEEKFSFGGSGSKQGQFKNPQGVQNWKNEIYILDQGNDRVQVFSLDGVFLKEIRSQKGSLKHPIGFALNSKGSIFIADSSAKKIFQFSSDGMERTEINDLYQDLLAVTIDQNDWLYVLEERSNGVWVHVRNASLNPLFSFHVSPTNAPEFSPQSINVYSGLWLRIGILDTKNGFESHYWINPIPAMPRNFLVHVSKKWTRLQVGLPIETFVDKHRLYRVDPIQNHPSKQIAEGLLSEIQFPKPVGEPPFVYQLTAVSRSGLEGSPSIEFRDFYHEGLYYFEQQEDSSAIEAFNAYRQKYDKWHGPSLIYLGRAFARHGRTQDAEKIYDILDRVADYREDVGILKGQMYLESQSFADAERIFRDLRMKKPESEEVLIGLSESLSGQGQIQRAIATLKEALKFHPNSGLLYWHIGKNYYDSQLYEKSQSYFETASRLSPDDSRIASDLAKSYQAQGKSSFAIRAYEKSLAMNAQSIEAISGICEVYLEQKNYAKVEEILENRTASLSDHPTLLILQGKLLASRGKTEGAIEKLETVAETGKAAPEIYLELARLYEQKGQNEKAVARYKQALEKQVRNTEGWVRLGELQIQLQEFDQAKWSFEQALSYQPNLGPALSGMGEIYYSKGEYAKAIESFQQAILSKELHRDSKVRLRLGRALRVEKRTGEAVALFEEATSLQPNDDVAFYELGKLSRENSFLLKAENALKRAVELEPVNPLYHYELGQVYVQRYQFDEAIRSFKKAKDLSPQTKLYGLALNQATSGKKEALETNANAPPVEVLNVDLQRVFAAIYKYYSESAFGEIKFRNNTEQRFHKVSVSFQVREYMDFPATFSYHDLAAHEILTVPIKASFSNRILDLSEDTAVQAQIVITYYIAGEKKEQQLTQPLSIYSRNALIWSDSDMVGAFITPKDFPIVDFARSIEKFYPKRGGQIHPALMKGIKIFDALGALNFSYVVDPNTPYSTVSSQKGAIDYVQFPRDSLKRRSGDCDDLVVLFATLMENLGTETQMVEVPGHLFVLFATGLPAQKSIEITNNKDLLVILEGKIWIPVELTLVGKPFTFAWHRGAETYRRFEAEKKVRLVSTHQIWQKYEPVTLAATSWRANIPTSKQMVALFEEDLEIHQRKKIETQIEPFMSRLQSDDRDTEARLQMGLVYARNGAYGLAMDHFHEILKVDSRNVVARVNLGNIYMKKGDLDHAIKEYLMAEQYATMDAEIKINLAIAYYQGKQVQLAKQKFQEAQKIDPDVAEENQYLRSILFD